MRKLHQPHLSLMEDRNKSKKTRVILLNSRNVQNVYLKIMELFMIS